MSEGRSQPSIAVRFVRHAESQNNQVYRDARRLFRGGTPEFDLEGWTNYVNEGRRADPDLSETGRLQTQKLASYLAPHLHNQASHPVRIIISPMLRTLQTIAPTLEALKRQSTQEESPPGEVPTPPKFRAIVHGFYHESEGCHIRDVPEAGMNQPQIKNVLSGFGVESEDISFEGFPDDPLDGWYCHGTGFETRLESETRASKFYVWLCEFLDQQLKLGGTAQEDSTVCDNDNDDDVFDAGVSIPGEEHEEEHDKFSTRHRRRRTTILVGHGDFMALVLKRIICGFGHYVETEGVSHRSAFVHFNTGITELEYFGHGRFLLMSSNQMPHLSDPGDLALRSGGSLKDGWAYLMPDVMHLDDEVTVAFSDEVNDHVKEQTVALKSLYLQGHPATPITKRRGSTFLLKVEQVEGAGDLDVLSGGSDATRLCESSDMTFVVKRGLQVVGCATYHHESATITDVVLRPSAKSVKTGKALMDAIKNYAKRAGKEGTLMLEPRSEEDHVFFSQLGFEEVKDSGEMASML